MTFNAIQNIILLFPVEREVFLRERSNGMYNVTPYFLSKIAAEMPFNIIYPVLFGTVVYFPLLLNLVFWWKYFSFIGLLILMYCTTTGFALIMGTIISDK